MIGEIPSRRVRMPVFKFSGGQSGEVLVRSRDVFGFHAHWLGKRSFMCPRTECAACDQFVGSRWHGLLAVDINADSRGDWRTGLLEITESAYGKFQFFRDSFGTKDFLGMRISVSRRGRKSPLYVSETLEGSKIVEETSEIGTEIVAAATATLYGLPSPEPGSPIGAWEEVAVRATREMISKAISRMTFA